MSASPDEHASIDLSSLRMTRRRLLGSAAAIAAAAAAASALPPNVRRALAQAPPRGGSLRDIKHVVLLMQENRSFDHYFGTLAGVRGFDDPNALKLPSGKSVFYQPDPENPSGYLLPFHLDTRTTSAQKIPSTSHAWEVQHGAWNGGKMDNWMPAHRKADGACAVCHGLSYAGRYPVPVRSRRGVHHLRRLPLFGARPDVAEPYVLDDRHGRCGRRVQRPNDREQANHGRFPLDDLRGTAGEGRRELEGLSAAGQLRLQYARAFQDIQGSRARFAPLHTRPGARSGGQIRIRRHERQPSDGFLDHPHKHAVRAPRFHARRRGCVCGQQDRCDAANPEVWAKTVFILDYDENDGIFDHVVPPTPPPGTPKEFVNGLPIGAGFRVPCIIVSPWTAGGWVCSQPFDHTSVLQFLEKFTGVKEPNITDWRRQTFGDLTAPFRFDEDRVAPPPLPDAVGPLSRARFEAAYLPKPTLPGAEQKPPTQEKGERKRIPRNRS